MKAVLGALILWDSVPQTLFFPDPFWFIKITTDPHILAHLSMQCAEDRYPKLKIYAGELILDSYESIPVSWVKMHYII